jgi:hypothetical protein
VALLITRRRAFGCGRNPDLQEMYGLGLRMVVFAVGDAGSCAHQLDVAGHDHRARAHGVLVFQRAFQHVRENFHVPVRMLAETLRRCDAVVVDHQQVGKAVLLRVVVVGEGKRMTRTEPAVLRAAALIGVSDIEHALSP